MLLPIPAPKAALRPTGRSPRLKIAYPPFIHSCSSSWLLLSLVWSTGDCTTFLTNSSPPFCSHFPKKKSGCSLIRVDSFFERGGKEEENRAFPLLQHRHSARTSACAESALPFKSLTMAHCARWAASASERPGRAASRALAATTSCKSQYRAAWAEADAAAAATTGPSNENGATAVTSRSWPCDVALTDRASRDDRYVDRVALSRQLRSSREKTATDASDDGLAAAGAAETAGDDSGGVPRRGDDDDSPNWQLSATTRRRGEDSDTRDDAIANGGARRGELMPRRRLTAPALQPALSNTHITKLTSGNRIPT